MIYVYSVNVNPSEININVGDWYSGLWAEVEPSDATVKSVSWHSSDPSIAAINEETGHIYANGAGTVTVYATAKDGTGIFGSCVVNVREYVKQITVTPAHVSLAVSQSTMLYETVLPGSATNRKVVWNSNDTGVVTVDPDTGRIYAVGAGFATVYATAVDGSGVYGSCSVDVVDYVPVTSVLVTPGRMTLRAGESDYVTATVSPSNATNKCVRWSSSDESIAMVEPETGEVYALSEGTAYICAVTDDGNFASECIVNVYFKKAIIIVPGVMGTELELVSDVSLFDKYEIAKAGTKVWPPYEGTAGFDSIAKLSALTCHSDGSSVFELRERNLDNYGSFDNYKNLYTELSNKFNSERDVLFFGYDWRKPNSESGNRLATRVKEYDRVVIVAHSMGGLVASHMLKDDKAKRRIDKLITLGTPFLGSLEMLTLMANGELDAVGKALEGLGEIGALLADEIIMQPLLREMSRDIPSLYELLPTRQYFTLGNKNYLSRLGRSGVIKKYNSFDSTKDELFSSFSGLNEELFDLATKSNDSLWNGNEHITYGVDSYYIVGEGQSTLCDFTLSEYNTNWSNITSAGDGTVTSYSASINEKYASRTFYVKALHNDLAKLGTGSDQNIIGFVIGIIEGDINTTDKIYKDPSISL